MQMVTPDQVVRHRLAVCAHCQQLLEGVEGEVMKRRQVLICQSYDWWRGDIR